MHSAKVAARIRVQIRRFSGEVSMGLPKTATRLVREVIYGVQSRGSSVRLSEIARVSRQLNRPGLRKRVRENLLKLAAPRVGAETLLVVDLTDVIKPYARKMEYLARVRDGSTKKLGNGYWCCQVVGLERGSAEVIFLLKVSRCRGRFISAVYVGLGCNTPSIVGEQDFHPLNVNGHRKCQDFGH